MPDFKGRKDFPEVADAKIKIGDYSGNNRLAVTDIYSPKPEPELRDQIMEPRKGKPNNYDSPVLSQQPVITLSDMDAEAALIRAIGGYVEKQAVGKAIRSGPPPASGVQGTLAPDKPAGGAGADFGAPKAGGANDKRGAFADTNAAAAGGAPAQNTAPKSPSGEPKWSATIGKPGSAPPGTPGGMAKPPTYSAFTNPGGGAGGPQKTTPGAGLEQGPSGPGIGARAAEAGRAAAGAAGRGAGRGVKAGGRGVGGFLSDLGQAAKVGVQQGIRADKPGAYEQGAEADERRGVQRGKTNKNPFTRAAASVARGAAKMPGMRGGAKAMGFGRTKAEEDAMRTRMEYAGNEEMALSDILNELDSYIANEQPNNSMVERQMTKGNISKMMRNSE